MTLWLLLVLALWVGCGLLAGGWHTAYCRWRFAIIEDAPSRSKENFLFAMLCLLLGPAATLTAITLGEHRHGWLITRKPLSKADQQAMLYLNRP